MKRSLPIVAVLAALGIAAFIVYERVAGRAPMPLGLLQTSGRIEGDRTIVTARTAGRVAHLLVTEGETIARGQIVARLEDVDAAARVERARQTLSSLEARLRSEQAGLAVLQAKVPLGIKAAEANVSLTLAVLQQCETAEDQLRQAVDRLREIEEPDDETRLELEETELAHEQAQQDSVVARAAVERAESDLELARLGEEEIRAQIMEVEALRTDHDNAEASLREAEQVVAEMRVTAPMHGTVAARRVALGEAVDPGSPLIEIVDLNALYVLGVIPESERAAVRPGQAARVYMKQLPGGFLGARVTAVLAGDTRDGAGIFAAKLVLDSDPGDLPLGAPVRVVIRVREDAAWTSE